MFSRTRISFLASLVMLAAVASGCIGDRGYTVMVHNATGVSVSVIEIAGGGGAHNTVHLAPNETATGYWLVPTSSGDDRRAVVLAVDDSGVLVFCRQFSFDEIKGDYRWQVDITSGPRDCR